MSACTNCGAPVPLGVEFCGFCTPREPGIERRPIQGRVPDPRIVAKTLYDAERAAGRPTVCDWRATHDRVRDLPVGDPCGLPSSRVIFWLDGTKRWSFACELHTTLEMDAPPHLIVPIPGLESGRSDGAQVVATIVDDPAFHPLGGASRGMGRCTCAAGPGTNPSCPVHP